MRYTERVNFTYRGFEFNSGRPIYVDYMIDPADPSVGIYNDEIEILSVYTYYDSGKKKDLTDVVMKMKYTRQLGKDYVHECPLIEYIEEVIEGGLIDR